MCLDLFYLSMDSHYIGQFKVLSDGFAGNFKNAPNYNPFRHISRICRIRASKRILFI